MTENIQIYFIVPNKCENYEDCTKEMQEAYKICKQYSLNIKWKKESNLDELKMKKTDIVVFQKFEGEKFENLKSKKSVLVGPWCLIVCLLEGKAIPNVKWPILTATMINCNVTCSGFTKTQKSEIEKHVHLMGGVYNDNLTEGTTHLVTDTVKSEKYIKAAECGLKIMLRDWVFEVYKASCERIVTCDDKDFEKHHCPTFHNLTISCTGFLEKKRDDLEKMIENNGGIYKGQLKVSSTDILICEKGSTTNAKYKVAKKSKKVKCVSLNWLTESIEKGYALPDTLYPVEVSSTSTPTKDDKNVGASDFSMLSNITASTTVLGAGSNNTISETINTASNTLTINLNDNGSKKRKSSNEWEDLVNKIDMKKVKSAGSFLDGCSILLLGFSNEQKDKLAKVLNFGGAVRYDTLSTRITHAIVGDPSSLSGLTFPAFPLLNVQWLIDSIEQKCPVDDETYLIDFHKANESEPKSPLCKKALYEHHSNTTTLIEEEPETSYRNNYTNLPRRNLESEFSDDQDTLAQILKNAEGLYISNKESKTITEITKKEQSVNESVSEVSNNDEITQNILPFENMKFVLKDFDDDDQREIKSKIEECGGSIMSESLKKAIPHYVVFPIFVPFLQVNPSFEIVSSLFILECDDRKSLIEIEYYHRPMIVDDEAQPLLGKVVTVSSYIGYERLFLRYLIEKIGGIAQDQFARVDCPDKDIKASTHLVTAERSGKKYEAALKWKIPVLNREWLIECATKGEYIPEDRFNFSNINKVYETASTSKKAAFKSIETPTVKYFNNSQTLNNSNCGTPKITSKFYLKEDENVHTPDNKCDYDKLSQVTPVSKIMEEVRKSNLLGTPVADKTLKPWNWVATPDSPLGAFIRPNPSPKLRKEMLQYINRFPDWNPPPLRRPSTPLSELKKQLWDKICPPKEVQENEQDVDDKNEARCSNENVEVAETAIGAVTTPNKEESSQNIALNNQLEHFQSLLFSSGNKTNSSKKRESTIPESAPVGKTKDSQMNSIGWDDFSDGNFENVPESSTRTPTLIFSGIPLEQREEMINNMQKIGATVLISEIYDSNCTHLICSEPLRNEKILACVASGKWILHTSYIDECIKAGKLVDEEPFEYGNPKAKDNPAIPDVNTLKTRVEAMHWWRKEIARRGYGPFHDMRAIVVAQKREPLIRVIEAGGGVVVNESPPFLEPVHATHCLLELRVVSDMSQYIPLAKQGIYCLNSIYISNILQKTASDAKSSVLPYFSKYYTNSCRD